MTFMPGHHIQPYQVDSLYLATKAQSDCDTVSLVVGMFRAAIKVLPVNPSISTNTSLMEAKTGLSFLTVPEVCASPDKRFLDQRLFKITNYTVYSHQVEVRVDQECFC